MKYKCSVTKMRHEVACFKEEDVTDLAQYILSLEMSQCDQ